jgi:hypothetical protein
VACSRVNFTLPLPTVQETGWAPGPIWTGVENLTPTGFDPRIAQLVASRYTDCAIRAHRWQRGLGQTVTLGGTQNA